MTGDLFPPAGGDYLPMGPYNGKPSYERVADGFFLWWSALNNWVISVTRGIVDDNWWQKATGGIEGLYTPQGTNTGDATVTEI